MIILIHLFMHLVSIVPTKANALFCYFKKVIQIHIKMKVSFLYSYLTFPQSLIKLSHVVFE